MSTVPDDDTVENKLSKQNTPTGPTETRAESHSPESTVTDPTPVAEPAPVAEPVEAPEPSTAPSTSSGNGTVAEPVEAPTTGAPVYNAPPAPPAPPAVSSVAAAASDGPAHAEPAPLIEPPTPDEAAAIDDAIAQSAALAEPGPVVAAEPATVAEPVGAPSTEAPEPNAAPSTSSVNDTVAAPAPVVAPQTVFVEAPQPPRKKGNRGIGILWVVLGTVVFAALFAVAIFVINTYFYSGSLTFVNLLTSSAFIVPVVVFFVAFVVAVLLINRAGWWAWVLGSLLIAAAVYFGSIGGILLLDNVVGMTPSQAAESFAKLTVSAPVILAAVIGREVTMWFGAAIASRGRRVKARNVEARAAYERELAESRGA